MTSKNAQRIDLFDQQIRRFLADRRESLRVIGSPEAQKLPIKEVPEKKKFTCTSEQAEKLGLDPAKVEAVYREIVIMCSSVQEC